MDELDVSYNLESEQQFWDELHDIVSSPCNTEAAIDNALRSFLTFTTTFKDSYLHSSYDIARCCYKLLESALFRSNRDYVRRQLIYGLIQEDETQTLHVMAVFLLFDGRQEEKTFEMMQCEGAFPRLVELVKRGWDNEVGLHRLLIELLYEMSRIRRLSWDDLTTVDDAFIMYLFQLIEELSDDANDPYHYPVIRVLLVLNEQYMCFAHVPGQPLEQHHRPITNRIIKVLSQHGPAYRTFGENLILLLNRESALGPQLLILKLLYILFTTPPTFEYFYTNDLHVLVDVIMRNLLDLDPGSDDDESSPVPGDGGGQRALRHTYLRVLYPLLRNTQLSQPGNHYKPEELRKLLYLLVNSSSVHFAPADETVTRLVQRCRSVDWLKDPTVIITEPDADECRPSTASPPTDNAVAKKLLGMNLSEAGESSLSVLEVTAKVEKEKPMVPAPRRRKRKVQDGVTPSEGGNGSLRAPPPMPVTDAGPDSGERSPFDDYNNE